jgi:hypothetical protein
MNTNIGRSLPIGFESLTEFFTEAGGYPPLGNEELGVTLVKWDLLQEENRNDPTSALRYLHWSLATSFLEWLNAIQWLAAGFVLQKTAYLPAQVLQSYYYSIFFSYGSFLALHGKGHYTVKVDIESSNEIESTRRELWFVEGPPPRIGLKAKRRGGEHQIRANWFYEVFRRWDRRELYPTVRLFEEDQSYHTGFRNMFTYSLFEMAEELHHKADHESITADILKGLWNSDSNLIEYFPEEYWALVHLKTSFEMHRDLVTGYEEGNPLTHVQQYLLSTLMERHEGTAFSDFIDHIIDPFLPYLQE